MQKITPSLWFNGNAADAVEFYTSVFPDSSITHTENYLTEGLLDFQSHMAGKPLTIDFSLGGQTFNAINAGPEFSFNPSTSFMVNFDPAVAPNAREDLDRLWAQLADGGTVLMPLQEYPFSPHYGWVQDRYGLSWQLILTGPEGEPAPFIIPALTFSGANQNRAAAAVQHYVSTFDDARTIMSVPFGQPHGPATADAVMFSDFQIGGQVFAAMDSPTHEDDTFNEAVSFVVRCEDQAEIDRFWAALSHVPESEQCGWCKDQFGVSWQIVPRNLGTLMAKPDAYAKLMQMHKIVIADF